MKTCKKYHIGEFDAMFDEDVIDHCWIFFCNLRDTDDDSVVDAAVYMFDKYNFDIEVLPSVLYDAVILRIEEDKKEAYNIDRAWQREFKQ